MREIGDIGRLLNHPDAKHTFKDDNPRVVGGDGRGLRFQGIFESLVTERVSTGENTAVLKFWGVNRSGEWVVVRVVMTLGKPIDPRFETRAEKAEMVEIRKVGLETLLNEMGTQPFHVWDTLGLAIQSWASDREEIYRKAQALASVVAFEQQLHYALRRKVG